MTRITSMVTKQQKAILDKCPFSNRLSKIFQNTTLYAPPTGVRLELLYKLSGKPEVPGQARRMRASTQLELPRVEDLVRKQRLRPTQARTTAAPRPSRYACVPGWRAGSEAGRKDIFFFSLVPAPLPPSPATYWA